MRDSLPSARYSPICNVRTEAGDTTANISGLIAGATYSLSIVALSTLWPSNEIDESFTIGTHCSYCILVASSLGL